MSKYERAMNNLNNITLQLIEVNGDRAVEALNGALTKEDVKALQRAHVKRAMELEAAKDELIGVHDGNRTFH